MDIKRHVYQTLLKWKNDNCHTTLEVNGARQVGKTYIINKFADENFSHKVYINLFELSGEQFLSCYQKACDWQPGEGPRPQAPLHDAFRLFDENFSDTEDTVIIIDEIQESAEIYNRIREFTRQFRCRFIVTGSYLGRIYEPEFRYSSGDVTSIQIYTLSYEEFLEAYHLARANGFANINVDLISAIPGQTVESWRRTLEQVMALSPEHISAYSLILEEGTTFYKKYVEDEAKEGPKLPDEDAERQMYWDTETLMEKNGYHRYEISNYAKEGYACRHNLGYWERIPYLGFGIGAASLVPGDLIGKCRKLEGKMSRYTNPDQLREYAHSYRNKFQAELLTEIEEMEEFMFLGLRKMNGISKKEFSEYFGKSLEDIYGEPICKLESLKLLEQDDDRVWLTKRGIDVSNSVFVEFLLEE